MRIPFRQGIVSAPPNFLQIGQNDSRYVDFVVTSEIPTVISVADRDNDYLFSMQRTVSNAWGPFANNKTYYLYWEIDQVTGAVLYGHSELSPTISEDPPPAPQDTQMWWNIPNKQMMVFDTTRWKPVLRVLAGRLNSGGILVPQITGSQVGINELTYSGYLMSDSFGTVYKNARGAFLTTESLVSNNDTGSLVKFEGSQLILKANENIPKFATVRVLNGGVSRASNVPGEEAVGICIQDTYQNDPLEVFTAGRTVSNDQWNWASQDVGKKVYCDNNGFVTTADPGLDKKILVGTIVGPHDVLLQFMWETNPGQQQAVAGISTLNPLHHASAGADEIISITQATMTQDGYMSSGDFARIPALEQQMPFKANVNHTHTIPNVTGLQTALDGKAAVNHNHALSNLSDVDVAASGYGGAVIPGQVLMWAPLGSGGVQAWIPQFPPSIPNLGLGTNFIVPSN